MLKCVGKMSSEIFGSGVQCKNCGYPLDKNCRPLFCEVSSYFSQVFLYVQVCTYACVCMYIYPYDNTNHLGKIDTS